MSGRNGLLIESWGGPTLDVIAGYISPVEETPVVTGDILMAVAQLVPIGSRFTPKKELSVARNSLIGILGSKRIANRLISDVRAIRDNRLSSGGTNPIIFEGDPKRRFGA